MDVIEKPIETGNLKQLIRWNTIDKIANSHFETEVIATNLSRYKF